MKHVFLCMACMCSLSAWAQNANIANNPQTQIVQALYTAFAYDSPKALLQIVDSLSQHQEPQAVYWIGYAKYYEAVYYLKTNQKAASEEAVKAGLAGLQALAQPNSEDYALMAILQNFSVQFISQMMQMGVASEKAKDYAQKALAADPGNIRAYVAAATCDAYVPEAYGGRKQMEGYLLKALNIENPKTQPDGPTWGGDEVYAMLAQFYLGKGNKDLARRYVMEGLAQYPGNYTLSSLQQQL
jgi:hypothetical protein